ncbi:MAG: MBL fold metallo-hydrolase [Desulfobacterales bacterium]|jgi:ribonuclease BN (tRNA processing enzyme)
MPSDITVTILGSGTCVPSLQRSTCAVLVEIGTSKTLLDSGAGTMRRLLESGKTIFELTHIFYSHFHPDHSGELVPLLFATKYPDNRRRRNPLTICAGSGLVKFFDGLKRVYGRMIELDEGMLNLFELDTGAADAVRFDEFTVASLPVKHNPESLAYRITAGGGRSVVYTGDSDMCENLVTIARDADLLICESALPDALKVDGHLTPSLAGEIATRANVGRLVLTHFYPECDQVDIAKECRRTYAGPLVLARDLMNFAL